MRPAMAGVMAVLALALVLAAVTACSGHTDEAGSPAPAGRQIDEGGDDPGAARFQFEGDPASPFCQRTREAADEPVLDPFAAGLEPREVELRFRALSSRFRGFAELAPPELEADLELVVDRLNEFQQLLEAGDYDFAELAARDVDLALFDDPELAGVAKRLGQYRQQVCERSAP